MTSIGRFNGALEKCVNCCGLWFSSCCRLDEGERVRKVSVGGIVLGAKDPGCCTLHLTLEKITSSFARCMFAHRKVGVDPCEVCRISKGSFGDVCSEEANGYFVYFSPGRRNPQRRGLMILVRRCRNTDIPCLSRQGQEVL